MRRRIHAFTLLEIIICVTLLAMMTSAFAWKGSHLLQHHLVRNSATTLIREIEAAHILALSYQTDVALKLVEKKGDFFLEWQTDEPFFLERCQKRKMPGVKHVRIDSKTIVNATIVNFVSGRSLSCKYIDFEDKTGSGCRIVLRQGKPVGIFALDLREE